MRETIETFRSMTKEEIKETISAGVCMIFGFAMLIALLVLAGGVE